MSIEKYKEVMALLGLIETELDCIAAEVGYMSFAEFMEAKEKRKEEMPVAA